MHSPPNQRFVSWLGKLATDLTEDGLIQQVELWHSVEGESGERLCTIRMEDRPADEDHETLAIELWNTALEDATTRPDGSNQRYSVRVYRAGDPTPEDSYGFLLQGRAVSSLVGGDTEPPTPRGMLTQEMRQTNHLHAMVIRMCEATAGSTAMQLEKERAENERLRERSRKAAVLEQDLLDRQHERDEARAAREKREERIDSLMTLATTMAPMLLSKLLEAKASKDGAPSPQLPDGVDPAELQKLSLRNKAIGSLMESLTADQVQTLMGILEPPQQVGMMQIYESFRQEAVEQTLKSSPASARGDQPSTAEEDHHGRN